MKKIIPIILAISMMLSLIPAVAANEAVETKITVKYDFIDKFFDANGNLICATEGVYSKTDGFWEYVDNSLGISTNNKTEIRNLPDHGFRIGSKTNDKTMALRIKINVPVSATYDISMLAGYWKTLPEWNVYLYRADEEVDDLYAPTGKALTAEKTFEKIATVEEKSLGSQYLSSGEYYVVFSAKNLNTTTTKTEYWLAVDSFSLTTTDLTVAPMWYISAGETSIEVGEETSVTMTATKNNDGTEYSGAPASYSASENGVVSVDASGNIMGLKRGKATVSAISGDISKSIEITVNDAIVSGRVSFMATSAIPNAVSVVSVNSAEVEENYSYAAGQVHSIAANDVVRVSAAEMPGYVFRGWVRGGTEAKGTFLRSDASFNVRLVSPLCLTAVYELTDAASDGDNVDVKFYNFNGQLITSESVAKGTKFENVTKPDMESYPLTGYSFLNWAIKQDEALAGDYTFDRTTRVVAQCEVEATKYAVDVPENMGFADGEYTYDTPIELNAGKEVTWLRNGKVVGYGDTYNYFVWDNETITTTEATTDKMPVIVLDTKSDGSVMIEWDSANSEARKVQVIEVGVLFNNLNNNKPTVSSYTAKAVAKSKEDHGQLATKDEGVARGYIAYRIGSVMRVMYTD